MPKVILLKDFINRLLMEGPVTKFTWLIGAGVSASAGLPLAKTISEQITMFEYMGERVKTRPWNPVNTQRINHRSDLNDFFDWYEASTINPNNSQFNQLRNNSLEWLKEKEDFRDVSTDNPKCYSMLFENLLYSRDISRFFLTNLVRRSKGVNLAHLALAGLLRDHSEWGHTVFTTNFDDLLLKALLMLNHTCRVFGEFESMDSPSLSPIYPQIVHLHGRHTGYRLLNTEEELSLNNPKLVADFVKNIQDTHLIVIGYSGWDDLIMNTLKDWPTNKNLLKGNLIWVPYLEEGTILPQTMEFLETCPRNRVHIIVDRDEPMDADKFLVTLADALNEDGGGFVPYRKGIIDHAKEQHDFLFMQLKKLPKFDPYQALKAVESAWSALKEHSVDAALENINRALEHVKSEDTPDHLRGKVFLEAGLLSLAVGKFKDAEEQLLSSLPFWNQDNNTNRAEAILEKANTLRGLAEVHLAIGNVKTAYKNARRALSRYEKVSNYKGSGFSCLLVFECFIREGNSESAIFFAKKAESIFEDCNFQFGIAISKKALSKNHLLRGNLNAAEEHGNESLRLFRAIDCCSGIGNALTLLCEINIAKGLVVEAGQCLSEAKGCFEQSKNYFGLANVENLYGDLFKVKNDLHSAKSHYEASCQLYEKHGFVYGLANALADLVGISQQLNATSSQEWEAEIKPFLDKIKELNDLCPNDYALKALDKLKPHVAKE